MAWEGWRRTIRFFPPSRPSTCANCLVRSRCTYDRNTFTTMSLYYDHHCDICHGRDYHCHWCDCQYSQYSILLLSPLWLLLSWLWLLLPPESLSVSIAAQSCVMYSVFDINCIYSFTCMFLVLFSMYCAVFHMFYAYICSSSFLFRQFSWVFQLFFIYFFTIIYRWIF